MQTLGKETHKSEEAIPKLSNLELHLKAEKKRNAGLLDELDNLAGALESTNQEVKKKDEVYNSEKSKLIAMIQEKVDVIEELVNNKQKYGW